MNTTKRKLLAFFLMMPFYKAHACVMGFSFNFVSLDEKSLLDAEVANNLDAYLNDHYGKNKWEYMNDNVIIKTPKIAENSNTIPVTIGANSIELAGKYKSLDLYVEDYLWVIDSKKLNDEYLSEMYHVDNLEKNSKKALNFKEISYKKTRLLRIAQFNLFYTTLPCISTRLQLPGSSEIKLVAVLVPRDEQNKIKALRQSDTIPINHHCSTTYFIDGDWPDGLRKAYRYE